MNEEALKILKMIEEGKITAEQGQKLLEALGGNENEEELKEKKNTRPLHIPLTFHQSKHLKT